MPRDRLKGLYLILDPSLGNDLLTSVVEQCVGHVDMIQILHRQGSGPPIAELAERIRRLASSSNIPLLINNDLELAQRVRADGVHFDTYDKYPDDVRQILGKDAIVGYTCGNDMFRVRWCDKVGADYLSFCAIYPSSSVGQCEIVPLETVRAARKIVKIPIFASGGINLENAPAVLQAGASGLAIISAIVKAQEPGKMAAAFRRLINEAYAT